MQISLLSGVLAVAVVGLGAWLFIPRGLDVTEEAPVVPTKLLLTGAAGSLFLFLLTLTSRPPFAPGGALGVGVLAGAVSAALVAWGAARPGGATSAFAPSGVLGAVLGAVAALMLVYRQNPTYALVGLLLGQGVTLFFLEASAGEERQRATTGLYRLFLAVGAAAVAGVALAVAQYEPLRAPERLAVGGKLWWALPPLVPASLLAGALIAAPTLRSPVLRAVAMLAVGGALLALFGARFPRYWSLFLPPLAGFVTGALVAALAMPTRDEQPRPPGSVAPPADELRPALGALLGPVLLLALLIVAYRLRTGLGISLAALGYLGAVVAMGSSVSLASLCGLQLLALAALFRLSYVALDLEATSVYLTAHYALIGMLAGALLPIAFGLLATSGAAVPGPALALAVVALPAGMLLLWGLKAAAGTLLGLVVGQAFLMLALLAEGDAPRGPLGRAARAAPFAPVLLLAVVFIQLLPPLAPLVQDLSRAQRALALLALVALLAVAARALGARERHPSGSPAPG